MDYEANGVPFSSMVSVQPLAECLKQCEITETTLSANKNVVSKIITFHNKKNGLFIDWILNCFLRYNAVAWHLELHNNRQENSPLIEDMAVLDYNLRSEAFKIHTLAGGNRNPTMFEPRITELRDGASKIIGSGAGRSSTLYSPFAKIECSDASVITAIEWSGTWMMNFDCRGNELNLQAKMPVTRFVIYPGETIRSPGIVILACSHPDPDEANAVFREFVYEHYTRKNSRHRTPRIFCNTCFTRGGGWLEETTEENQISLINAYADLGAEAVITDAGWFDGFTDGRFGDWQPRKDHYPKGIRPVAEAAQKKDIIYGLWFEPEKVGQETTLARKHPEWLLKLPGHKAACLNFGIPEARHYLLDILEQYFTLPGFGVYRQDLNFDPLPFWQAGDSHDRQGVTEMKYIAGMYEFWGKIAEKFPDCLLEGCSGGGHRIDLGAIKRMDIHQKSDCWFDNEADQTSLWALSQYIPNNVIVSHLRELDEYSFHSALPASLCLGWIADDPDFDRDAAAKIVDQYKQIRHCLVGKWYPLTPPIFDYYDLNKQLLDVWALPNPSVHKYCGPGGLTMKLELNNAYGSKSKMVIELESLDSEPRFYFQKEGQLIPIPDGQAVLYLNTWGFIENHTHRHAAWIGSQYHRDDLQEGFLLLIRRPDSPYSEIQIRLRSLKKESLYRLEDLQTKKIDSVKGSQLSDTFSVQLTEKRQSKLIRYQIVS